MPLIHLIIKPESGIILEKSTELPSKPTNVLTASISASNSRTVAVIIATMKSLVDVADATKLTLSNIVIMADNMNDRIDKVRTRIRYLQSSAASEVKSTQRNRKETTENILQSIPVSHLIKRRYDSLSRNDILSQLHAVNDDFLPFLTPLEGQVSSLRSLYSDPSFFASSWKAMTLQFIEEERVFRQVKTRTSLRTAILQSNNAKGLGQSKMNITGSSGPDKEKRRPSAGTTVLASSAMIVNSQGSVVFQNRTPKKVRPLSWRERYTNKAGEPTHMQKNTSSVLKNYYANFVGSVSATLPEEEATTMGESYESDQESEDESEPIKAFASPPPTLQGPGPMAIPPPPSRSTGLLSPNVHDSPRPPPPPPAPLKSSGASIPSPGPSKLERLLPPTVSPNITGGAPVKVPPPPTTPAKSPVSGSAVQSSPSPPRPPPPSPASTVSGSPRPPPPPPKKLLSGVDSSASPTTISLAVELNAVKLEDSPSKSPLPVGLGMSMLDAIKGGATLRKVDKTQEAMSTAAPSPQTRVDAENPFCKLSLESSPIAFNYRCLNSF